MKKKIKGNANEAEERERKGPQLQYPRRGWAGLKSSSYAKPEIQNLRLNNKNFPNLKSQTSLKRLRKRNLFKRFLIW